MNEGRRVLLLPGWLNSDPGHWQSRWERLFGYQRVEQADWEWPRRGDWMARLEEVLLAESEPVVLVAHSLGCQLIASWAEHSKNTASVAAALLVAPPDTEAQQMPPQLHNWRPIRRGRLPFPSIAVISSDDPYLLGRARRADGGRLGCEPGHRRPAWSPEHRVRPGRLARGSGPAGLFAAVRDNRALWSPKNPKASASAWRRCSAPRSATPSRLRRPRWRTQHPEAGADAGRQIPAAHAHGRGLAVRAGREHQGARASCSRSWCDRSRRTGMSRYEIIAGERRFRAAKLAGLREMPVLVQVRCPTRPPPRWP